MKKPTGGTRGWCCSESAYYQRIKFCQYRWTFPQSLTPIDLLLLYTIGGWQRDESFPETGVARCITHSVYRLARETHCSERTVRRSIERLERSGFLKRMPKKKRGEVAEWLVLLPPDPDEVADAERKRERQDA